MSVKKLFRENPYLTSSSANITKVEWESVLLDQTIIYAFSGGQASDKAWINDYEVLKAEKDGKEIVYTLPVHHTLNIGDTVALRIDRETRYRLMKLHFAAELVLEVINQLFQTPEKVWANITPEKARIDFFWEGNIADVFPQVSEKVDALIQENLPIVSAFSDEEAQRRYREIEGFAKVSCGWTHLKRTGEIGEIWLKRVHLGKGKERVEIFL